MLDFCAHLADKFGAGALAMPSPDRTLMWSSPMTKPIPELTPEQQARFWAKVDMRGPDGCWPWTASKYKNGYGQFGVGRQLATCAHRIAATLSGINVLGLVVMHSCDNPSCVNPSHLSAGTQRDNLADMRAKGRGSVGETVGRGKLTASDIPIIRADPRLQWEIAADYGIAQTMVSMIKRRVSWAHVK